MKSFYFILLTLLLCGCAVAAPAAPTPSVSAPVFTPSATTAPSATPLPTHTPLPEPTRPPSPTPTTPPSGPDEYPAGVNPLTGLPAADPALLDLPPVMVSISNSPVTARPQRGLSYSPLVFEMYLGEGITRFLALFYGGFPPAEIDGEPVTVGPIRSGRLPYETLRQIYKGVLFFASASDRVLPNLDEYRIVYGSDAVDINDARITPAEMEEFARQSRSRLGSTRLTGQQFNPAPPAAGKPASGLWIPFHFTDQVLWRYDAQSQTYQRYQDQEDGKNFTLATDALTGQPLGVENVIVLFTTYHFYDPRLFEIDFKFITRSPALLFRDGVMQEIYWTTGNDEYERKTGRFRPIRFVNYERQPIPLKPGRTWVEIVPLHTPYGETVDTLNYRDLLQQKKPGSGFWAVYFYPPAIEEGLATPTPAR